MKITAAESRIMDVLWRLATPVSSEEVAADIGDEAEWSHGTVRTFLTRLVKKKAVAADKEGRRYLYRPLLARADFVHAEGRHLLDRLFGGRITGFVTQMAEREDLTSEELAELRQLIERLDRDR